MKLILSISIVLLFVSITYLRYFYNLSTTKEHQLENCIKDNKDLRMKNIEFKKTLEELKTSNFKLEEKILHKDSLIRECRRAAFEKLVLH